MEKSAKFIIDVSAETKRIFNSSVRFFSKDHRTAKFLIQAEKDKVSIPKDSISRVEILFESVDISYTPTGKVIFNDDMTIEENGLFSYVLPDELLNYSGLMAFEVYIYYVNEDAADSSNRIIYEQRVSAIDRVAGQVELVYIKDMETAKREITEQATEITENFLREWNAFEAGSTAKMQALDQDVTDLENRVGTLDSDVSGLEGRTGGLKTSLDGLDKRASDLETETGNLETKTESLAKSVTSLETRSGNVEGRVSKLETDTAAAITKTSELSQKNQRLDTEMQTLDQNLTELRNGMKLSEAWSNSPDGTVDFSRTKPRSTATPWASAPSDSTLENEFSKYHGLALTDSNDPADYVWVESPEYTRYKAQINSEDLMLSWHTGQQITKRHLIDFKGKVLRSTVENCNIVKYSTTLTPSNTSGWEVIQSNYSNIATLDGNAWRIAIADDQKRINAIFSFNLVEQINRDRPGLFESVGADTLVKQIAFLKANITCLKSNIWGYGVSPSGNKLTLALWSDNGWYSAKSHTASDIQQLTNELTTNIGIRIQNDGFVYALAYAEPSDGTTASTVNIDYASLEYTLSFKKSDFDISKDQYAKDLGEIKEWIQAHS
ncbi:BppU family phage baseplate upper protein [Enterococcus dispar]|uniref:BppU N-terminal domain-containing protein n=1 Tax=Enterococcus dispar ATCC 51266 TaxID=1139219 RepID=S1NGG0_9ENTE|nr:BppU family phage baseplate upper protein [Enterococcus dispar]EOT42756.1 hypothetical protein OMK_01117 [Enterococcus dispar ATCC 51266]EOW84793.1 hypothetical protein I569_00082 [Enterococcus dispar ATCC 51266]OJG38459.1 hypothetical protein RV01_GL002514 [Enterococcus dispar]